MLGNSFTVITTDAVLGIKPDDAALIFLNGMNLIVSKALPAGKIGKGFTVIYRRSFLNTAKPIMTFAVLKNSADCRSESQAVGCLKCCTASGVDCLSFLFFFNTGNAEDEYEQ